jgi:hypothetical protein
MLRFTAEAQRTQSLPLEMFLHDLCASVAGNLHASQGSYYGRVPEGIVCCNADIFASNVQPDSLRAAEVSIRGVANF